MYRDLYAPPELINKVATPVQQEVNADEILAQTVEPSLVDQYIAGEVRHARKEIEQFHLTTLERFRDEIKANLEMRKRWAADSEAQLECINDAIERIGATRLKENSNVNRNDSTRAAGDSDVSF